MTKEQAVLTLREAVDEAFDAGIEIISKDGEEAVVMAIEALQERKAKWSEVIATNVEHSGVIRHFCCSYCGRVVSVLYPQELELLYPYCHCGAKMEVDE